MSAILEKLIQEMPNIEKMVDDKKTTAQRDVRLGFKGREEFDPTAYLQAEIDKIAKRFGAESVDYFPKGRQANTSSLLDPPHAVLHFKCAESSMDAVYSLDDTITELGGKLYRDQRNVNGIMDGVNFNIAQLPVSIPHVKNVMVPKKILGIIPIGVEEVPRTTYTSEKTGGITATYSVAGGSAHLRVELRHLGDPNFKAAVDSLAGLFGYKPAASATAEKR